MRQSYRRLVAALAAVAFLASASIGLAASDAHFATGYKLYKEKKYAEALAELTQSTEMSGSDYNFFLVLTNTYLQLKKWGEAVEPAKKAISIDPGKKDPHLLLGKAYMQAGNFAEAADAFAGAAKIVPDDFQINYSLGYCYFKAGKIAESIPVLQKAMGAKADDYNVLYTLGAAFVKSKKCEDAKPLLEKAKTVQPKQAESIDTLLLSCYSASGDMSKMAESAKAALAKNPKDLKSLDLLATIAMNEQKWDEAIGYYQKIAEIDTKTGDSHYKIGMVLASQKKYDEAMASYQKAVAVKDKCDYHLRMGELHEIIGSDIQTELQAASEKDPDAEPDQAKTDQMMTHYKTALDEYKGKICQGNAEAKKNKDRAQKRLDEFAKIEKEAQEEEAAGGAQ